MTPPCVSFILFPEVKSVCIRETFLNELFDAMDDHVIIVEDDDVIKWKHFPRYWPFVRRMFSLICAWINAWVNNSEAGVLRRHRAHYDVIVMKSLNKKFGMDWFWKILPNGFVNMVLNGLSLSPLRRRFNAHHTSNHHHLYNYHHGNCR